MSPSWKSGKVLVFCDQGANFFYQIEHTDYKTKKRFSVYQYICKNCNFTVTKPQEMTYHPGSRDCIIMARIKIKSA
jgi:hypothetical protein